MPVPWSQRFWKRRGCKDVKDLSVRTIRLEKFTMGIPINAPIRSHTATERACRFWIFHFISYLDWSVYPFISCYRIKVLLQRIHKVLLFLLAYPRLRLILIKSYSTYRLQVLSFIQSWTRFLQKVFDLCPMDLVFQTAVICFGSKNNNFYFLT